MAIGFFLQPGGFSNGSISNPDKSGWKSNKYSSTNLNEPKQKRTISLLDKTSAQIVTIGFEDKDDNNFSDATFYLDIEQKDAVEKIQFPIYRMKTLQLRMTMYKRLLVHLPMRINGRKKVIMT